MNDLTVQVKFIKCSTQEAQAEEMYLNQSINQPLIHSDIKCQIELNAEVT